MSGSDKVALITGATSGIGRAAALAFAERGDAVAFSGRRRELGEQLAAEIESKGGRALFVEGDVSNEAASEALVNGARERFGGIDYAFNNAGLEGQLGPLVEITEANFEKVFRVNVLGVLFSMKHQLAALNDGGSVVNNASVAGLVGMPGASVYSASKGAVLAATRTAAQEAAARNIRVNALSPAGTYSEAFDRFFNHDKDAIEAFASQHALGRIAEPKEMADVVLWLCSDASSFVTGQNIVADGGLTTR